MTLDEAIKRYSNNAEYERTHGNLQGCLDFRQLAEWLKDYKRLKEQEPCEDCIRRSDIGLTDFEIVMCDGDYKEGLKMLLNKIEKAPSVTPQSKVGYWEWVQYDGNPNIGNWNCSECHSIGRSYFDFCPFCGCKMQEVEE